MLDFEDARECPRAIERWFNRSNPHEMGTERAMIRLTLIATFDFEMCIIEENSNIHFWALRKLE
jgi:hypothetical protein